jgi:hypothetical protein
MMIPNPLCSRWNSELKYWYLRWWQFLLMLVWSTWPWVCTWIFPEHLGLWLFPQAPFLPFGYLIGGLFMAALPDIKWAYPFGMSFTIFSLTYLALVSWRWHRKGKKSV